MRKLALLLLFLGVQAQAAITHVATTTADHNTSPDITVNIPSGTQDNDVMFACYSNGDAATTDITMSGWTRITFEIESTFGNRTVAAFYKVASSEPASILMDNTGSTTNRTSATISTFRGVDTSTPLDVTYVKGSHYTYLVNDDTPAPAAITTNTNGAWVVTCLHEKEGTTSAIAPSSGYTERAEILNGNNVLHTQTKEVTTAGTETPGDITLTGTTNADNAILTFAFKPGATAPTFSAAPSCSATTNGVSCTYTASATSTAYGVGVSPGDGAPTCTQIKAGQNDGGSTALSSGSDSNTGTSDTITVTATGKPPRLDYHFCLNNAGGDSAVDSSQSNEDRSPNTDKSITALASLSATSFLNNPTDNTGDTDHDGETPECITGMTDTSDFQVGMLVDVSAGFADLTDLLITSVAPTSICLEIDANSTEANITVTGDDYYNPDAAIGDVLEGADDTSNGDAITWGTDGNFSYTDTSGGAYTTIDYCIEDVSSATTGLTTTPGDCFTTYDQLHLFNPGPAIDLSSIGQNGNGILVLTEDAAMTAVDFDTYCTHDEGLALTYTNRAGNTPTGTTISEDGDWTGTPTTEDESGVTLDIRCGDTARLYAVDTMDVYVVNTVTMPDITGDTLAAGVTSIETSFPWLTDNVSIDVSFTCHASVANGDVISQTPTASSEVSAFPTITASVSTGICASDRGKRTKGITLPGVSIGS